MDERPIRNTPLRIVAGMLLVTIMAVFSGCELLGELFGPPDIPLAEGEYLLVANEGVDEFTPGGEIIAILPDGSVAVLGSGFFGTSGLVSHPETGNLFISDDNQHVYKVIPGSAEVVTITDPSAGFDNPNGLACDSQDRLLVADAGDGTANTGSIWRLDLETTEWTQLAEGFAIPQAMVEYDGIIYFTDFSGKIFKIDGTEESPVTPETVQMYTDVVVSSTQGGLIVDGQGNLYVADASGHVIRVDHDDQEVSVVFEEDGYYTRGLALSTDGSTLFITGHQENEVLALDISTGDWSVFCDSELLNGPFGIVITHQDYLAFSLPE